eukprot:2395942-Rhodomonas_salina.1
MLRASLRTRVSEKPLNLEILSRSYSDSGSSSKTWYRRIPALVPAEEGGSIVGTSGAVELRGAPDGLVLEM